MLLLAANLINWPVSYVQVEIDGQVYSGDQLPCEERQKSVRNFHSKIVRIIKREIPENFFPHRNLCVCDFDGCCLVGRINCEHGETVYLCRYCGNCGRCRNQECNHICCKTETTRQRKCRDANDKGKRRKIFDDEQVT